MNLGSNIRASNLLDSPTPIDDGFLASLLGFPCLFELIPSIKLAPMHGPLAMVEPPQRPIPLTLIAARALKTFVTLYPVPKVARTPCLTL